jgi:uncharacterized protein (DUF2267 family)
MERIMSATGVTALDHTVQETNVWLKAVEEELQLENRQQAYNALRAVLHALRDRMPPEVAIKLGAQLPILLRGIYYENWHAAGTPTKERHAGEFADHVGSELPQQFPVDPLTVTRGVFEILWEKLDPGEFAKVMQHLPAPLRDLKSWD